MKKIVFAFILLIIFSGCSSDKPTPQDPELTVPIDESSAQEAKDISPVEETSPQEDKIPAFYSKPFAGKEFEIKNDLTYDNAILMDRIIEATDIIEENNLPLGEPSVVCHLGEDTPVGLALAKDVLTSFDDTDEVTLILHLYEMNDESIADDLFKFIAMDHAGIFTIQKETSAGQYLQGGIQPSYIYVERHGSQGFFIQILQKTGEPDDTKRQAKIKDFENKCISYAELFSQE